MSQNVRYPDFLGIGVQKAGTTWLFDNLRRHPSFWLPAIKELHYFDYKQKPGDVEWSNLFRQEKVARLRKRFLEQPAQNRKRMVDIAALDHLESTETSDQWYGETFAFASDEFICGEITPSYSTLAPERISHLRKLKPDVKIILSLRDPIDRYWSNVRMSLPDKNSGNLPGSAAWKLSAPMLARSDYPTIISNWLSVYPRDQMMIIFFDQISAEPVSLLRQVCEFLGAPFEESYFGQVQKAVHVGQRLDIPEILHAQLKYAMRPVYQNLRSLFPDVAGRWYAKHFETGADVTSLDEKAHSEI